MGKKTTKTPKSYMQNARDRTGLTREEAADRLCMNARTLGSYELRESPIPRETLVQASDMYSDPYLLTDYCAYDCPIGKRLGMEPANRTPLAGISKRLTAYILGMSEMHKMLIALSYDNKIDKSEEHELAIILDTLGKMKHDITELESVSRLYYITSSKT